jgi:hypothetical protein
MRYVALSALLAAVSAGVALHGGAAEPAVADPWPPQRAARIRYDHHGETFVLANVSPHVIWYEGFCDAGRSGPHIWQSRTLPTGELVLSVTGGRGSGTRLFALAPGRRVALGRGGGEPRRVGVTVCCPAARGGGGVRRGLIFSDAAGLPSRGADQAP